MTDTIKQWLNKTHPDLIPMAEAGHNVFNDQMVIEYNEWLKKGMKDTDTTDD